MAERLTKLEYVKEWLNISTTDSDAMLTQVIDAASQFVLEYLNWETFQRREYLYRFNGTGAPRILLQNWPVIEVVSVAIHGQLIQASTFDNGMPSPGYYVNQNRAGPQSLELAGHRFGRGIPCQVVYEAGFEATAEFTPVAGVSPEPDILSFTPYLPGVWSGNIRVLIDGAEAAQVASAPAAGQYTLTEWGTYTFSVSDAGRPVEITYSYTPSSVSQATAELVGEWFKRRERIGLTSKTLGGQETVAFSVLDMSAAVKSMLQPYKNVVPV